MLIRKLFKAEMAHTTIGAYTKRCHHVHGHSYKFELFLECDEPNPAMMVTDFKAVKDVGLNDFFDSFDHALVLGTKDVRAKIIAQINPDRHILAPINPTAEMLAKSFFVIAQAILDSGPKLSGEKNVLVAQVIVHETDTGYAAFRREDLENDKFPDVRFDQWVFSDGIKAEWKSDEWYKNVILAIRKPGSNLDPGLKHSRVTN